MVRISKLALSIVAGAAFFSGGAYAGTRSDSAVLDKTHSGPANTPAANAQGPKNGFPDTPGMERAMDRANEHARFKRHDSEG